MKLLSDGKTNAKTLKSIESGLGYYPAILYLAPAKTSGVGNVCTNATPGCKASCLFTAGFGVYNSVQESRKRKTILWYKDRPSFLSQLKDDMDKFVTKCKKLKLKPCIRLNGTSDIKWEDYLDLEDYPIQFYDYTKHYSRMLDYLKGELPKNYHLTFSRSELNEQKALELKRKGANVAVVFRGKELPAKWKRFTVFNGDKHDYRFLDPTTGLCGLTAKGKAKKDTTGFVVNTWK